MVRLQTVPRLFYVITVAALWCCATSCNRKDPNIPKVDSAIRLFNGRFNAARFREIYLDADPRFRQSVGESEFTSKLALLLQEHGPIRESNINGFEGLTRWQRMFPEFRPSRSIAIFSKCDNGGFQELFVFDVTGQEAKLVEFETDINDHNKKLQH